MRILVNSNNIEIGNSLYPFNSLSFRTDGTTIYIYEAGGVQNPVITDIWQNFTNSSGATYSSAEAVIDDLSLSQISPDPSSGGATEVTLLDVLAELQLIFAAVDELELKVEEIKIDADQINLNTDEIESKLENVKTKLDSIIANTTGLNLEVTQLLVKSVLDAIKLKTDNLDVLLSTRASESTLLTRATEDKQDDQIVLSTLLNTYVDSIESLLTTLNAKDFATETTLLQIKGFVDGIESLLTTISSNTSGLNLEATQLLIKGVLDNIKTKTDNLDVALSTRLSESDFDSKTGSLTETAPTTDTASSGLNGRLQRIAQRISSLIALIPTTLVGGRFDINIGSWFGSTVPTVGQKTSANSIPVVFPTDQVVNVNVENLRGATGLDTTQAASTTSVTLRSANSDRKELIIYNSSTKTLWIKEQAAVAVVGEGIPLFKDEVIFIDIYKGEVRGIWETSATGFATITEITT